MKKIFGFIMLSALAYASLLAQTACNKTTDEPMKTTSTDDSLKEMRQQIDTIDSQLIDLLAQRMKVCRQVGEYKKRNDITVIQSDRYHEILVKRSQQGASKGLDTTFVKNIMNLIHDESVRQQEELQRGMGH